MSTSTNQPASPSDSFATIGKVFMALTVPATLLGFWMSYPSVWTRICELGALALSGFLLRSHCSHAVRLTHKYFVKASPKQFIEMGVGAGLSLLVCVVYVTLTGAFAPVVRPTPPEPHRRGATPLTQATKIPSTACPAGIMCIAVADIDGKEAEYGVTDQLVNGLRAAVQGYAAEVIPLGRTITAKQGQGVALAAGRTLGASVVVWGFYSSNAEGHLGSLYFDLFNMPHQMSRLIQADIVHERLQHMNFTTSVTSQSRVSYCEPMTALTSTTRTAQVKVFSPSCGITSVAINNFDMGILDSTANLNSTMLMALGMKSFAAGDYRQATNLFDGAISETTTLDPLVSPSLLQYYLALTEDNGSGFRNVTPALKEFTKAIHTDHGFGAAYYARAADRMRVGDFQGSINDFSTAISLSVPLASSAYNARGAAEFARAVQYQYMYAARVSCPCPSSKPNLSRQARVEVLKALSDFGEAIRLDRSLVDAYYNRGIVLHAVESGAMADHGEIDDFSRVLHLHLDDISLLANTYYDRAFARYDLIPSIDVQSHDYQNIIGDLRSARDLYRQVGDDVYYQAASKALKALENAYYQSSVAVDELPVVDGDTNLLGSRRSNYVAKNVQASPTRPARPVATPTGTARPISPPTPYPTYTPAPLCPCIPPTPYPTYTPAPRSTRSTAMVMAPLSGTSLHRRVTLAKRERAILA